MKIFIGILLIGIVFAKQKQCGRNAHFTDCGPPCPVTCDNRHNPPDACIMVCVSGCHCNEGFVRTRSGRCVKPQHCAKSGSRVIENCVDKPDNSLCRPRTLMWYFDQSKDSCQQFLYGGCGGNGNRYETEEECMEKCKASTAKVCGENERYNGCVTACPLTCENFVNPPKICTLQCVIGCECEKGYVRRADGKCIRPEQCPNKQPKSEEVDCTASLDPGVCDAFISRFYYDPADESCKEFIYGGCQGNSNNFKTVEECKATCGAVLAKSSSAFVEEKTDINKVQFLGSTSTAKPFTTEVSPTEITSEAVTTLTEKETANPTTLISEMISETQSIS